MKKLAVKLFGVFTFGLLSLGSVISIANAQGGFGSVGGVSDIQGIAGASNATAGGSDSLIKTIKNFINWMLGMLALIAMVILIWGGFQMVTAAGDDAKYKKGFKILQQAAVGLVFIGVSWLIVSVIFRLIGTVTK